MAEQTLTNKAATTVEQYAVDRATAPYQPAANPLQSIVNFIGGVGTAVYLFFQNKEVVKKQQQQLKAQQTVKDYIDSLLQLLESAGVTIIDQTDLKPKTQEFENLLKEVLYSKIGYTGNCEADIPNFQKNTGIMFKIRGGGGQITEVLPSITLPYNLNVYWQVTCKNIHDNWQNYYVKKQLETTRKEQTATLVSDISSGNKLVLLFFGLIASIILGLMIKNALGGKNGK